MTTLLTPAERIAALKAKGQALAAAELTRSEVSIDGEEIVIALNGARGSFEARLAQVKRINVRHYDGTTKTWRTKFSQAMQVQSLVDKGILVVDSAVRTHLAEIIEVQAGIAAASSAASAGDFVPNFELPEGLALFPYQVAGVKYACMVKRCIIGDQMGLGKTLQALAAIVHLGIERAVISVPQIVWTNWQDEAARFFPTALKVVGVRGRKPHAIPTGTNVVVVGQDVLVDWEETLTEWGPQALVLDESHNYKTVGAKRSQAALALAQAIPTDGLVLLLTGTVIENRPAELIQQLRIVGRLAEISGTAKNFLYRYADGTPQGLGTPDQHKALLEALRGSCYLRRQMTDVLPELPDIFRTELTVEDNVDALRIYKRAEDDMVKWLALNLSEEEAEARIKAHLRAEAITRMTLLRKLAAMIKMPAIAEWAAQYSAEKPLIIFAHHKEVIASLVDHLGCPKIDGSVDGIKRGEICKEFQAGKHNVIVLATRAGGIGINLQRAATVLFVEMDWSPGRLQQAECRIKRPGQTADKLAAIYARTHAETIDSKLHGLVSKKWKVIEAINAGLEDVDMFDTSEDDSIIDGLLDWLANR